MILKNSEISLKIPFKDRILLKKILPYLDPDYGHIEEVKGLLHQISKLEDLLSGAVISLALVAQGNKKDLKVSFR